MLGISLKRTASIIAEENCTVLMLTRDALDEVLLEVPQEGPKWNHILGEPLHLDQHNLKETKFFAELSEAFVVKIQKHLSLKLFYKDDWLIREGEYGCEMYVLQRGTISILKNSREIVRLKDHGIIGEMAVLGADKRTASVMCKSLCVLQVLHGDVFNTILESFPEEHAKFDTQVMCRLVGVSRHSMLQELQKYDDFYGKVHPNRALMQQLQEMFPLSTSGQQKVSKNGQPRRPQSASARCPPRTVRVVISD